MAKDPNVDLIQQLIALVKNGTIQAVDETSPVSNNRFVFTHQGVEYSTEWLQDDKPTLFINGDLAICNYIVRPLICELSERFSKPTPSFPEADRWRTEQATKQRELVGRTLKNLKRKKK